ncbi:uncharacterized protein EV420DRAFT_1648201 [Desarmillaria tabescens]|uniref:Uncharacterized protein n=1 Tax=Armillaria tabescens TaxID=1929756 RepID=A0AA39MTU8_ARMTA|nr:uncharacterized protein EV420DRAFT_1648201 [Desarmillaria tabescens]KAK0445968.1 hypothetical protein EV420DRAFT_1648201 [Desarmillaria tabescens]
MPSEADRSKQSQVIDHHVRFSAWPPASPKNSSMPSSTTSGTTSQASPAAQRYAGPSELAAGPSYSHQSSYRTLRPVVAYVASLVHRLEIVDPIPKDPRHHLDDTWIASSKWLPAIIQLLSPHLRHMALTSEGYHYQNHDFTHVFHWRKATAELKGALLGAFLSKDMVSVELSGVVIDSCQSLFELFVGSPVKTLALPLFWHAIPGCVIRPPVPPPHLRPQPHSLSVRLSDCFVNYMLSPYAALDICHVRDLTLKVPGNFSPEIRPAATKLFLTMGNTVEKLVVEENIYFGDIPEVFQLTHCQNLKVVQFITTVYTMDNSYWTYLSRMLETIAPDNHMEEVLIKADLYSTGNSGNVSEWLDWGDLDEILTQPRMSYLKSVRIELSIWGQVNNHVDDWVRKGLPALQKNGVHVKMQSLSR